MNDAVDEQPDTDESLFDGETPAPASIASAAATTGRLVLLRGLIHGGAKHELHVAVAVAPTIAA